MPVSIEEPSWWDGPWPPLILGVLAVLVGLPSLVNMWSKRGRLTYRLTDKKSLLTDAAVAIGGKLTVAFNDQPVRKPWLSVTTLENPSSKDVPTEAFDQDRPIILSYGVPVLAVLDINDNGQNIAYKLSDNQIHLGPDLIAKRSQWSATVVTNGEPKLTGTGRVRDFQVSPPVGSLIPSLILRSIGFTLFAFYLNAVILNTVLMLVTYSENNVFAVIGAVIVSGFLILGSIRWLVKDAREEFLFRKRYR